MAGSPPPELGMLTSLPPLSLKRNVLIVVAHRRRVIMFGRIYVLLKSRSLITIPKWATWPEFVRLITKVQDKNQRRILTLLKKTCP